MLTNEEKQLLGCVPGAIILGSSKPWFMWRGKPYANILAAIKKLAGEINETTGAGVGHPTKVYIGDFRQMSLSVDFESDGITVYNAKTGNLIGKVWIGETFTEEDAQTLMKWETWVYHNMERCTVCGEWFRGTTIEEPVIFPNGDPAIQISNKYYHQWSFGRVICNDCLPEFEKRSCAEREYFDHHQEIVEADRRRFLGIAAKN